MLPYTHELNAKETLLHPGTSSLWRWAQRSGRSSAGTTTCRADHANLFQERVALQ